MSKVKVKQEISLEDLERSVNALEHFIEETTSSLDNAVDRLDNVKKMTMLLIKQRDDLELKEKNGQDN
jgi:hypothetical protein